MFLNFVFSSRKKKNLSHEELETKKDRFEQCSIDFSNLKEKMGLENVPVTLSSNQSSGSKYFSGLMKYQPVVFIDGRPNRRKNKNVSDRDDRSFTIAHELTHAKIADSQKRNTCIRFIEVAGKACSFLNATLLTCVMEIQYFNIRWGNVHPPMSLKKIMISQFGHDFDHLSVFFLLCCFYVMIVGILEEVVCDINATKVTGFLGFKDSKLEIFYRKFTYLSMAINFLTGITHPNSWTRVAIQKDVIAGNNDFNNRYEKLFYFMRKPYLLVPISLLNFILYFVLFHRFIMIYSGY